MVSVRTGDTEVQIMEAAVLMRSLERGVIIRINRSYRTRQMSLKRAAIRPVREPRQYTEDSGIGQ
jgi:hypothetical protein